MVSRAQQGGGLEYRGPERPVEMNFVILKF